jgi:predicted secreted hydrolase
MRRRSFLMSTLLATVSPLCAGEPEVRYPSVRRGTPLGFPRDHGAHPDFRTEWWYVTGVLSLPRFDVGFQLTFFRRRPGKIYGLDSPIAATQILFAHAAISRPDKGLLYAERAARANLGAGFSTTDCDIFVGAWSMKRRSGGMNESFYLKMQDFTFAFDLVLTPSQPLLLQGDQGYSQKGPVRELASYYVSWPHLKVDGTLLLEGKRHSVGGVAWFDHEWSSEVLGVDSVGWDWIGINLADGGALMAFQIRNAQGGAVFAHATLRNKNGNVEHYATNEVRFVPIQTWLSPRNGASYPVRVEIYFGKHRILTMPLLDDQEITMHRPAEISYWEGLVSISGTLAGRGYLEMTGYAKALELS